MGFGLPNGFYVPGHFCHYISGKATLCGFETGIFIFIKLFMNKYWWKFIFCSVCTWSSPGHHQSKSANTTSRWIWRWKSRTEGAGHDGKILWLAVGCVVGIFRTYEGKIPVFSRIFFFFFFFFFFFVFFPTSQFSKLAPKFVNRQLAPFFFFFFLPPKFKFSRIRGIFIIWMIILIIFRNN